MVGTASNDKLRLAFSLVNGSQYLSPCSRPASNADSECGAVEFTREDVEALVREKIKSKNKFNYKERCENMMEYIKRPRLCIRWFQELEGEYAFEQEKLRCVLELTERRCYEMEVALKNKDGELNFVILELRKSLGSLQENLVKEEFDKVQAELDGANRRIVSINDMYKLLQDCNSSIQLYNSKLQTDLTAANETIKRREKERLDMVENLHTLRSQHKTLQDQLTSSIASQEGAVKQKDALMKEVACLRMELHQIKDDQDQYQQQAQSLAVEVSNYKELATNSSELEEKYLSQGNQIQILHDQLVVAERKLQMLDMSALKTKNEFEGQKKLINELHKCLEDAESKLVEGEKLRKKLHNTILELKGNIRVFCRVRPYLFDDSLSNHGKVFSYPTPTECKSFSISTEKFYVFNSAAAMSDYSCSHLRWLNFGT